MAKVMMIDDDLDFLEIQRGVLESRGHNVVTCDVAANAIDMAKAEQPDVIVVDLMMEEEDSGFSLCYQLKKGAAGREFPIIMVTGVASEAGIPFEKDAKNNWIQADAFLNKPIRPEELISAVENLA